MAAEGGYECGGIDQAAQPSRNHYQWHHDQEELPCPKSLAEAAWRNAELRKGEPIPNWRYQQTHECGGAEQAKEPSEAHHGWHRYHRTRPCPKSRAEHAWQRAEKREKRPLPDYPQHYQPQSPHYQCGTAEQATAPGTGHYKWHYNNGTRPCPKSRAERAWAEAQRNGQPATDGHRYKPLAAAHECGQAHEATEPSEAHYQWHRRRNEPPCPKSLAEKGHYQAIRDGRGEGYEYGGNGSGEWPPSGMMMPSNGGHPPGQPADLPEPPKTRPHRGDLRR